MHQKDFVLSFIAIFVAMDIIGILPMYIGMTHGLSKPQRNQVVNTSMLVAFLVAVFFVFTGQALFRFIGITIFDFKIAGGIVLLLISLADLVGGPSSTKKVSGSTGIVPLAVPLITGPGVLTTLVLQVASFGYLITLLAMAVNYVLSWIFLRYSHAVTRVIGKDGTVVVSKIAALLLTAIAIAMIRSGIFDAVKAFHGP